MIYQSQELECKGAGRIQFFHHFDRVGIRSAYRSDGKILTRTLPPSASRKMLADTDTRVVYGDSVKSVAERVLKKYQDRIIADTAEKFDLREEIEKAEPYALDFRRL
ncbi:hypothetical protein [Mesorhizobium sp. M0809]|uniref:hypothetical protein n=1 Tax=Mesorhizobium sp. M0809 TaxID=2957003 RepID=UPI00333A26D8